MSACLVGDAVRWDGGHKRDDRVAELGRRPGKILVELVSVCPEVELGLGVPREPIDRVERHGLVRLESRGGKDLTGAMRDLAAARIADLVAAEVSGYVFKSRSPSCAVTDAAIVRDGTPTQIEEAGAGVFAAAIIAAEALELLPITDENQLADPVSRASFWRRVLAWSRISPLFGWDLGRPWRRGDLVELHRREELLLMAHSPAIYRELGALVAAAAEDPESVAATYRRRFLQALSAEPSRRSHVNALEHIAGSLDAADRSDAAAAIARYRAGDLELAEIRAQLYAAAARGGHDSLTEQTYLTATPW